MSHNNRAGGDLDPAKDRSRAGSREWSIGAGSAGGCGRPGSRLRPVARTLVMCLVVLSLMASMVGVAPVSADDKTPAPPSPSPSPATASQSTFTALRVDVGGNGYTDAATGLVWEADRAYTPAPGTAWGYWGPRSMQVIATSHAVGGGVASPVYQTQRLGVTGYQLTIPNGKYKVTIRLAELHLDAVAGSNVFDVFCQSSPVLAGVDAVRNAGLYKRYDVTFNCVVSNSILTITFVARAGCVALAGLDVENTAAVAAAVEPKASTTAVPVISPTAPPAASPTVVPSATVLTAPETTVTPTTSPAVTATVTLPVTATVAATPMPAPQPTLTATVAAVTLTTPLTSSVSLTPTMAAASPTPTATSMPSSTPSPTPSATATIAPTLTATPSSTATVPSATATPSSIATILAATDTASPTAMAPAATATVPAPTSTAVPVATSIVTVVPTTAPVPTPSPTTIATVGEPTTPTPLPAGAGSVTRGSFTVVFQEGDRQGAMDVLDAMDTIQARLSQEVGLDVGTVEVELFATRGDYNAALGVTVPADQVGNIADSSHIWLLAPHADNASERSDILKGVQVEMTRLALQQIPNVPLWMRDGVASYEARLWDDARQQFMRSLVSMRRLASLRGLEGQTYNYLGGSVTAQTVIDYLTKTYGIQGLVNLVASMKTHPLEQAIQSVLGVSYSEFDRNWLNYVRTTYGS